MRTPIPEVLECATVPAKWAARAYTDRVNELIEAKRRGNEVEQADEAPAATNVVDLVEALQRSVASSRGKRGRSTAGDARNPKKGVVKAVRPTRTVKKPRKRASVGKVAA